jgi:hypothetical protein
VRRAKGRDHRCRPGCPGSKDRPIAGATWRGGINLGSRNSRNSRFGNVDDSKSVMFMSGIRQNTNQFFQ